MVTVETRYVDGLNARVVSVREEFNTRETAEAYAEMVLAKGLRRERRKAVSRDVTEVTIIPPHRILEIVISEGGKAQATASAAKPAGKKKVH